MIKIEEHAKEESTYVFVVTLTDEEGDAVVPASLKWTLTDKLGTTVINEREQVVVTGLGVQNNIVLSGDDLQILSTESGKKVDRRFIVEGTYDSTLGSGLPVTGVAGFVLDNFVYIG